LSIAEGFLSLAAIPLRPSAFKSTHIPQHVSQSVQRRYLSTPGFKSSLAAAQVAYEPQYVEHNSVQRDWSAPTRRENHEGKPETQHYETFLLGTPAGAFVTSELSKIRATTDSGSADFQIQLARVADTVMRKFSPAELDGTIRYLVEGHGLKLRGSWVYHVMEHSLSYMGYHPMFSWLQFCLQHKWHVRPSFVARFYYRCQCHWKLSVEEINELYYSLHALSSHIPAPTFNMTDFKEQSQIKPSYLVNEKWVDFYIRSSKRYVTGGSSPYPDEKTFRTMYRGARNGDWNSVWTTYKNFDGEFSLRCLRLAVLARLNLDQGSSTTTKDFLWAVHSAGHGVTEALTPLLMAQLAEGNDPYTLIHETVHRGLQIHDMVYNEAAKRAFESGLAQGVIEICHTAARQNGSGDLLYNEFNFLNLVRAHVRLHQYSALGELLSVFTSQYQAYASSQRCKSTLKLAMKALAKRATCSRAPSSTCKHKETLDKLNEAYVYGSRADASVQILHEASPPPANTEKAAHIAMATPPSNSVIMGQTAPEPELLLPQQDSVNHPLTQRQAVPDVNRSERMHQDSVVLSKPDIPRPSELAETLSQPDQGTKLRNEGSQDPVGSEDYMVTKGSESGRRDDSPKVSEDAFDEADKREYVATGSSKPIDSRDVLDKLVFRGNPAFSPRVSARRQQLLARKRMTLSSSQVLNRFSDDDSYRANHELRHSAMGTV
jgi:hypothetical protein